MIDREIKSFILKVLLAANGQPMQDDALRRAVRTGFSHVTIPVADLKRYISECENAGWIAGTNDELEGVVWALTLKGKNKAEQLP